ELADHARALVLRRDLDADGRAGDFGAAREHHDERRDETDTCGKSPTRHRGSLSHTSPLDFGPVWHDIARTMTATIRAPRVYEQIVAHVEREIYEGRLRQGQKLPPERQLPPDLQPSRLPAPTGLP